MRGLGTASRLAVPGGGGEGAPSLEQKDDDNQQNHGRLLSGNVFEPRVLPIFAEQSLRVASAACLVHLLLFVTCVPRELLNEIIALSPSSLALHPGVGHDFKLCEIDRNFANDVGTKSVEPYIVQKSHVAFVGRP